MADELLSAVIRLENQIQQQLQQEQTRADVWLAGVRTELEQQNGETLLELSAGIEQIRAAATQSAKQAAGALEATEKRYCGNLGKISDQTLEEILRRQLVSLLPGQTDDHQDVKS